MLPSAAESPKTPAPTATIVYPESDGKPIADNTRQFRWITDIKQNLDQLYAANHDVFVAGDLLWYPVEGRRDVTTAPDVMVVFGRPKGDRGSYKQWEEANTPPQVVFEILSPSNTLREMAQKLLFFDRYGVDEYYIYDPDTHQLEGWLRTEDGLTAIVEMTSWISPRLRIRFESSEADLQIFYPDGRTFQSFQAVVQRAEQAEARAARLAARLRELGIDPEEVS